MIQAVHVSGNWHKLLFESSETGKVYSDNKEKNKSVQKKLGAGGGEGEKVVVLGMRLRNGQVGVASIPNNRKATRGLIKETVRIKPTLCTDEHHPYQGMSAYRHRSVYHSAKHHLDGLVLTNGVEKLWDALKYGSCSIYHALGRKNLQLSLDEFVFRHNSGNIRDYTFGSIGAPIGMRFGKRLTYSNIIAGRVP
ncbi:MAG: transposase [Holophagaceae bacterium]|nr:transposase [Holophagaceae bacterium]